MTNEEINPEEVLQLVEKAQAKGTFDITEFAKGRAYPEDSVVAYLDVQAAYELSKLNERMREVTTPEELEPLEKAAEELAKKVTASKVTFYMRGVNQAVIEKSTAECDRRFPTKTNSFGQPETNMDWLNEWTAMLVASNLVKTENANGDVDERDFTAADVVQLRHHLPKEVWEMLVEKMQKLTLATAYFEGLTDAGFLQKS
jgi:hypothetical protein